MTPMIDFSSMPDDRLLNAEDGLHTMFAKAVTIGADTTGLILTHEDLTSELRSRGLFYEPLSKADDGHDFSPVRNICRSCRKHGDDHADSDHALVPVRDVCRTCGQGGAVHKSVSAVTKALPELSVEQRQQMAQSGVAMPDGSFPIPDEAHLHAAIRLVGQAQDPQSAMNHIIERAKAMGMEDALPPAWNTGDPARQTGAPQIGEGAHSMVAGGGKPSPAQSSNVRPTPGAGVDAGAVTGAGQPTKPGLMKRLAKAVGEAMGADFDEQSFLKEMAIDLDPEFDYAMIKSRGEERYTLGPIYMPDTLDAHNEWATAEDLEKAAWNYFKSEDHNVYLQHSDRVAGELVALMPWPNAVEATMMKSIDGIRKEVATTFPAGTVYAGVLWEPWAFEDVKKGKITGFSMGGWAKRLEGSPVTA